MPQLPTAWTNEQILGFFRFMWQQWQHKERQGASASEDPETEQRGPAPPAAVAAAAKIAFTSLGRRSDYIFRTESHKKPIAERSSVDPVGSAFLERTASGTLAVLLADSDSDTGTSDFTEEEESTMSSISSAAPISHCSSASAEDQERQRKCSQWLRSHSRALFEVGRLPFNNVDLWQLHQHFFSPPNVMIEESPRHTSTESLSIPDAPLAHLDSGAVAALGKVMPAERRVSVAPKHERPSSSSEDEETANPAKRVKHIRARISYFPRTLVREQ